MTIAHLAQILADEVAAGHGDKPVAVRLLDGDREVAYTPVTGVCLYPSGAVALDVALTGLGEMG